MCVKVISAFKFCLSIRELDHAMLRRLEKRILVNLPSSAARQAMMSHWLPPLSFIGELELRTELDYETLAEVCDTVADKHNKLSLCASCFCCGDLRHSCVTEDGGIFWF